MKKIISLFAAVMIIASIFAGCGAGNSSKINVMTREEGSGTRSAFIELFGIETEDESGEKIDNTIVTAETTNSTSVMMTSVAGDPSAIGYISMGSLNESVRALQIDGVDATVENIKNGTYKASRPFNIAVKDDVSETAKDFISFIMSSEGQKVVEENGYISQGSSGSYSGTKPSGTVTVAGSSSVTPVMEKLKEECNKYDSTVTQYLTSVLTYSIYKANYIKSNSKKPIKVCIPVNLKKYFPSKTMSNFFSYITLEANMNKLNSSSENEDKLFDNIIEFVKNDFKSKLTEEEIAKTMSANVKLGTNFFIKAIPLELKKIIVRLSYLEIRKYTTITFSNIGRIGIIGKYKEYIDEFLMLIAPEPVEKIKCSGCTYENKMSFTFTSILNDNNIEKTFYHFLINKGINVKIESNGVLDDISKKD